MPNTPSPLPWRFMQDGYTEDANGDVVSALYQGTSEADADLIVRAVNSHAQLVAALTWAIDQIEDDLDPDHQDALNAARAALALAKEET